MKENKSLWQIVKLWLLKKCCRHKWNKIYDADMISNSDNNVYGKIMVFECTECGKHKKLTIT